MKGYVKVRRKNAIKLRWVLKQSDFSNAASGSNDTTKLPLINKGC